MTRYDHLSKTEHIFSMTEREANYLKKYLQTKGPLTRKLSDEQDHDNILESCKQLINGKQ